MSTVTPEPMSKAERLELVKIVRQRARLAKDDVAAREAQIVADAEAALARRFSEQDEAFKEIIATARQYMAEVKEKLDAKCAEMGIPAEFRPGTELYWFARGANADPKRRAEIRAVVRTQAAASAKQARVEIDRQSVAIQEQLMAGSLESIAAKDFLAALPSPEALMPALQIEALEAGR
ncbi:MAG TPA: hypothetical protein VFC00_29040 [Micromonosporaceae bacterium]|nr:hypothetical protein [Micromonosporaceae bacterium]